MKSMSRTLVLLLFLTALPLSASAREWSCPAGKFKVEGDAIAFNDNLVVIKKPTGELIALEVNELCEADQEFVKQKENQEQQAKNAEEMQTWTARDGMKVRGKIVSYGEREVVVRRKLGKVEIDGKSFEDIDDLHQRVILKVLSNVEKTKLETQKDLENWAKDKVKGQPKKYDLRGVLMRLESGDVIGVPFFMFSDEDLEVLKPGWEHWLAKKESQDARDKEDFLMRSAAMAYQRDRAVNQQIEMVKLDLLGATAGVVDIWQVGLVPRPGVRARPFSVMVTAQNNLQAQQIALQKYPKFVVGGVRRASARR